MNTIGRQCSYDMDYSKCIDKVVERWSSCEQCIRRVSTMTLETSLIIQLTLPFRYWWRSLIPQKFARSEYLRSPNAVISSHTWFHLVHTSTPFSTLKHTLPWFPGSRNLSVLYQMVDDYIPNMTLYHDRFDLCGPWLDFVLFLVLLCPRTILSRRWPNTMGRSSPPIPMYLDLRWVSAENWHVDLKARDLRKADVIKHGSAKIQQVLVCLGGKLSNLMILLL